MTTIPAPTLVSLREEWPDADFDLPEGAPIIPTPSDKEDEDWDFEMDLGKTGGAKALANATTPSTATTTTRSGLMSSTIIIRPPLLLSPPVDDEDDGVSTIKASISTIVASKPKPQPAIESVDEDFEDGFSLPAELTQLSLAPLSLSHRPSKNSIEWVEKDVSSSSQSSDAYSTLGFAEASSSSNSTSSASLPDTETEDEDELEGLLIPSALFESGHSASKLKKILDSKKNAQPQAQSTKPNEVDPEDDFEAGLVINDDLDLSPSRLVLNTSNPQRNVNRSSSAPQKSSILRPPSRAKLERSKSPSNPPLSSTKQLQKIRLSPSPPLRPPSRSHNFQSLISSFQTVSPTPSPNSGLFPTKPGSLRGQKSHTGLKPTNPPCSKKLTRKASLSLLLEANHAQASASCSRFPEQKVARYEEPTAASRAKIHKNSTSRIHDFKVPPTRPCTPSSNTAALRLTMPTQSRLKSRPALSQVFAAPATPNRESPPRAVSPLPSRPPSNLLLQVPIASRSQTQPSTVVPKLLRRPKRLQTYGDGTELDHIEDLPTDRDKEVRYRVQPKGYGNRIPGATYASKVAEKSQLVGKGTLRRKGKLEGGVTSETPIPHAPSTNTLRRTSTRIDLADAVPKPESSPKKKKKKPATSPTNATRRKPTLIRNLGGTPTAKVVGEMKWNPQTLRWEGNEQVLRDFDAAVGTSTRPALITHLSVSSIGSFASGARVVGNMVFDPSRMCWMSTLPPEQDEPDVFANLADDEEDGEWDRKGNTIRAHAPRVSDVSAASSSSDVAVECVSPAPSHARTMSESGSDRGSRASMVVCDIDDAFIAGCRAAQERHRHEMKGWKTSSRQVSLASDRSYLYEIRALATRQY